MDVYGCGLPCSREPDPSKIVAVSYSLFSFSFYIRAAPLSFDDTPFDSRYNVSMYHRAKTHASRFIYLFFFLSFWKHSIPLFLPPKMNEGNVSRVNSSSLRDRERERRLFSQSKYKRSIMDEKKEKEKNDDRRKDTYVVIMSSSGIINAHVITLRLIRGFKLQVNALV